MIDASELKNMSKSELISIFRALNYWKWPEILGEKPEGWDKMPNYKKTFMSECQTKEAIIRPYARVIYSRINKTELLA